MAFDIGASQFAGGGFMASPQGGQDAGYGGGTTRAPANKVNTVRHVTVKQILRDNNSGSDEFMVDGKDVNSITFVGRIVSVQEQASRIAMKVHDGTGLMDVTSWVNDSEPETLARQREELQVGRYVRVYGNLKRFGNTISVTCYTVRPVSDYNDITYQNLQVIYQHLHITRGQAPPMASMQPTPTHMPQHQQQQQWASHPAPVKSVAASAGDTGVGGAGAGSLDATLAEIFHLPEALGSEGLDLGMVMGMLQARGMNPGQSAVMSALERLVNEGQLYTTCDDNHWRTV